MQSRPISEPSRHALRSRWWHTRRKRVVELREQSVREAEDAHHAVLEALAAHSAVRGHCAHGSGSSSSDKAQRVGIVDRDVHDNAAARFGLLNPPALQMRWQIDGVKHPCEQRLADAPRVDRVPHRPVRGARCEDDGSCPGSRRVRGTRRPSRARRRASAPAASRRERACLPSPPRKPGRGAARWWSRCRLRRRRSIAARSSRLVVACAIRCSCAILAARSAFALMTATTSPPLARKASIMCSRGDRAGSDRAPTGDWSWMGSRKIEVRRPAGSADDQGRRAKHRFRLEVPACEVAHQELRRAGPQTAAVDRDGGQGGKRVLGLFDVVEADHGEVRPTATPASVSARTRPIATTSLKQRAAVAGSWRLSNCGAAAPPPDS